MDVPYYHCQFNTLSNSTNFKILCSLRQSQWLLASNWPCPLILILIWMRIFNRFSKETLLFRKNFGRQILKNILRENFFHFLFFTAHQKKKKKIIMLNFTVKLYTICCALHNCKVQRTLHTISNINRRRQAQQLPGPLPIWSIIRQWLKKRTRNWTMWLEWKTTDWLPSLIKPIYRT